jgi:hypothetical protein
MSGPTSGPTRSAATSTSLDHGALVVTPVEGATPKVGRDQAARLLANTQVLSSGTSPTPQLADVMVTLPPRVVGQQTLGGTTHVPLAWVYLVEQDTVGAASGCLSAGAYGIRTPPSDASRTYAVIMDAGSGVGYVYSGAGTGICGPSPAPTFRRASWRLSIPFATTRYGPPSHRQTFDVPACGTFVMWSGGRPSMAEADVATGPCQGKATTRVDTGRGRVLHYPHARTGLLCFGLYDALVGKPADCAV